MFKCFCESTGCAGREVSKRVFDAHTKLDRAAQIRKLQAASERVLKDQDEALATYISSMTLSDKISGASQHPSDRCGPNHPTTRNQLRTVGEELAIVN